MTARLPERWVLVAGGAAVLLGLYLWVVSPIAARLTRNEQRLVEAKRILAEAETIAARLDRLKGKPTGTALPEGFTLFSFVESDATKESIKDRIEYMRPLTRDLGGGRRELGVDLRIAGVPMDKLLAFLEDLESGPEGVRVRQMILQPSSKGGLDVDLSVAVMLEKGK